MRAGLTSDGTYKVALSTGGGHGHQFGEPSLSRRDDGPADAEDRVRPDEHQQEPFTHGASVPASRDGHVAVGCQQALRIGMFLNALGGLMANGHARLQRSVVILSR
jgi:hypothetical protein